MAREYESSLGVPLLAVTCLCVALTCGAHDRIRSGGLTRHYVLHVPESLASLDQPAPLILVFHGAGGSAIGMRDQTDLDAVADRLGYVVAYLEGSGVYRGWGLQESTNLRFVADVIERLRRENQIDATRVYAVGFSDGASLALRLACDPHRPIAAFVSVAATMDTATVNRCSLTRDVSALFLLGTDDPTIRWESVNVPQPSVSLTADETMRHWARINGCSVNPVVSELHAPPPRDSGIERWDYAGCRSGTAVSAYVMEGQGHGWPQPLGAALIARFFEAIGRKGL